MLSPNDLIPDSPFGRHVEADERRDNRGHWCPSYRDRADLKVPVRCCSGHTAVIEALFIERGWSDTLEMIAAKMRMSGQAPNDKPALCTQLHESLVKWEHCATPSKVFTLVIGPR